MKFPVYARGILFGLVLLFFPLFALAQDHTGMQLSSLFGILELPFLLVCVYFSFRVASSLKGGTFGRGMQFLAWGFVIMAVGHLHMQAKHFFGFDLFTETLGQQAGTVLWFVALIATWSLSAYGFREIYRASKQ
ncbi:MAG: hypothetical protein AAF206_11610 [Bacteroidota bacterium]